METKECMQKSGYSFEWVSNMCVVMIAWVLALVRRALSCLSFVLVCAAGSIFSKNECAGENTGDMSAWRR